MYQIPYYSLDQAREEIKKRQHDKALKEKVNKFLSSRFIPGLGQEPKAALIRSVLSPDSGFDFFYYCSKYIGLEPLIAEYTDDLFVGLSEEKLGLARLRITLEDNSKKLVDIVDFKVYHGKKIPEVKVVDDRSLIDFHHDLFKLTDYKFSPEDISGYFHSFGKPSEYYPYYFANFIVHGVLFENFAIDSETHEKNFTNNVVVGSLEKIKEMFGVYPIIVRLYPEDQTSTEDFFWWSYNKNINDKLIKFSLENKCKIKDVFL